MAVVSALRSHLSSSVLRRSSSDAAIWVFRRVHYHVDHHRAFIVSSPRLSSVIGLRRFGSVVRRLATHSVGLRRNIAMASGDSEPVTPTGDVTPMILPPQVKPVLFTRSLHTHANGQAAARDQGYESAVFHLNSLQSNSSVLNRLRQRRSLKPEKNLEDMRQYLSDIGIKVQQIDTLNVIHIAGTKGKGSTCAFVESILRELGFKTGFYSSPHLVHVRERIRINSLPISEIMFAENFFEVYDKLTTATGADGREMPAYFKFLTLMAFHVFLKEKVDVAIIEVGIGGEFDCTNVLENPVACGITTLDLDHTSILGTTMPEIAWHKAGIMKKGSLAVCVDQPEDAMAVIRKRAVELDCGLCFAPDIDEYDLPTDAAIFKKLAGDYQGPNLSLALQLVKIWLERTGNADLYPFSQLDVPDPAKPVKVPAYLVPEKFLEGLENFVWKGRGQVLALPSKNVKFFLDGAHTPKSIALCAAWYLRSHSAPEASAKPVKHVLLFTCTADRTPESLLPLLAKASIPFEAALFSTTQLMPSLDKHNDNANLNASEDEQKRKCQRNKELWAEQTGQDTAQTFSCISDALSAVETLSKTTDDAELHVLVTGSLHLVGGVLAIVEKSANSPVKK
uniref:tetrahydrofolate synthase n=1 Tax=Panagrellus redivivus TaxID=6233 RepID=A0A7E4WAV3_PANRE